MKGNKNPEKAMDREALVRRHNPVLTGWNPQSPLTVGNGDFAFTADFTGLQTCAGDPPLSVPRCTMAQLGFHRYPDAPKTADSLRLAAYRRNTGTDPHAKSATVGYMTDSSGQEELFTALRVNPHRFHLAKAGLFLEGMIDNPEAPQGPRAEEILAASGSAQGSAHGSAGIGRLDERAEKASQTLDLWTGTLRSRFMLRGEPVQVTTRCHPALPLLAVRIESPLAREGKVGLDVRFPYGSHEISGADWNKPGAHQSRLQEIGRGRFSVEREMDDCRYTARLTFSSPAGIDCRQAGPHHWVFTGRAPVLEFTLFFDLAGEYSGTDTGARGEPKADRAAEPAHAPQSLPDYGETRNACAAHWKAFWSEGAAISFEGSADPRAFELERRIVLSQYLLAIQSLGSLPPAETGLTCNSWYGKFHLEMHPWHALHALLWNRAALVKPSLDWYSTILAGARTRARGQGYHGARWPKMTDPAGQDSPSPIGCLLCWQQPHIILFAELLYRLEPSEGTLSAYAERVFDTAAFMADYAGWDEGGKRFILGEPLIPAQENHPAERTLNPTFELEYWRWGLTAAIEWKRRIGEPVPAEWETVLRGLSPCPVEYGEGERKARYRAHENCADTFGTFAADHPAMVLAYGFLPPQSAEGQTMSDTCDAVLAHWNRETLWGWDFPALAMTFARLGRREDAVNALLMESPKNTYLANGHNRQTGHDDLPLYLPGNGALLLAAAMMAAGWDGSPGDAPGFPNDGTWKVRHEGFARYL